jgi:Rieske Fe-S protein
MAVWEGAGLADVEGAAGAGVGAGAGAEAAGAGGAPPPLSEFWQPPRASPMQAAAMPMTMRFISFSPDVTI